MNKMQGEKLIGTNRRRSTGQQPGTKSGRRPVDKPLISGGSTGYRVPPHGLQRILVVRASEESFRTVFFDALATLGAKGTVVS